MAATKANQCFCCRKEFHQRELLLHGELDRVACANCYTILQSNRALDQDEQEILVHYRVALLHGRDALMVHLSDSLRLQCRRQFREGLYRPAPGGVLHVEAPPSKPAQANLEKYSGATQEKKPSPRGEAPETR